MIDPTVKSRRRPTIPLVRLNLLQPFLTELDVRGLDTDALLMQNGLVRRTTLDPDIFIPVVVISRFLEEAAEAASDPYLGVQVGENLDLASWRPFLDAVASSFTLVDFIYRFIKGASGEASSAHHSLEFDSESACFREIRVSAQEIPPAQNDGFTAAYLLNLIRRAVGGHWSGSSVIATVCDPDVVPKNYLGVQVSQGDRMGVRIRFPSSWLVYQLDQSILASSERTQQALSVQQLPTDISDALHSCLKSKLSDPGLSVREVADYLGISGQKLQRSLRSRGTTLTQELAKLRYEIASSDLAHTGKSVAEIAESTGFSSPAGFTRAFRSWSGVSPREYRRQRRLGHPSK